MQHSASVYQNLGDKQLLEATLGLGPNFAEAKFCLGFSSGSNEVNGKTLIALGRRRKGAFQYQLTPPGKALNNVLFLIKPPVSWFQWFRGDAGQGTSFVFWVICVKTRSLFFRS